MKNKKYQEEKTSPEIEALESRAHKLGLSLDQDIDNVDEYIIKR